MNFEDKNILIVGGSSGIGLSLVNSLSKLGANVYVISRKPSADWPKEVKHLAMDITESLNGLSDFLPESLNGLVYAVGTINLKPFSRFSDEDFLNDYRLNVLGAARVIQLSLKSLKNAGSSSVVLFSSVAARVGMPYHASISAAKGAVEGLALSLSAELASSQIRVNVIAPSLTDTPLSGHLLNTPDKEVSAAKRHPLGRYGQASDISRAAAFLLAEENSWITGQVISIDGGLSKIKVS